MRTMYFVDIIPVLSSIVNKPIHMLSQNVNLRRLIESEVRA